MLLHQSRHGARDRRSVSQRGIVVVDIQVGVAVNAEGVAHHNDVSGADVGAGPFHLAVLEVERAIDGRCRHAVDLVYGGTGA